MRILLVEDDLEQALLYAQVLELSGYTVCTAMSAEEALQLLTNTEFALLISDWDLPTMKGDDLISLIKTRYPFMKTVLFSNHARVNDACLQCHADAFFRKLEGITRLRQITSNLLAGVR